MNHYRLKKDLPTFKAGQTFHTDAQGNLWLDDDQGPDNHRLGVVMAYHYKTIEHFPNILDDWFEEIVVPDPSYLIAKIQKLENSVKELDERLKEQAEKMNTLRDGINELHERLKTTEEITERLLREDNDRIIGKVKPYEPGEPKLPPREEFKRMKQHLRNWIEKNEIVKIETRYYSDELGRRGVSFVDKTNAGDNRLTIIGWPTIGLADGAVYRPEAILITGEAGEE